MSSQDYQRGYSDGYRLARARCELETREMRAQVENILNAFALIEAGKTMPPIVVDASKTEKPE